MTLKDHVAALKKNVVEGSITESEAVYWISSTWGKTIEESYKLLKDEGVA